MKAVHSLKNAKQKYKKHFEIFTIYFLLFDLSNRNTELHTNKHIYTLKLTHTYTYTHHTHTHTHIHTHTDTHTHTHTQSDARRIS